MLRLFLFLVLLSCLYFKSFSQKGDTVVVENDPLIITHKIYVLETKNNYRNAVSFSITPGFIYPKSNSGKFHFKNANGLAAGISYERLLYPVKIRIGAGMGSFNIKNVYTNTEKKIYQTISVKTDTVEMFFKVRGNDTIWIPVEEIRKIKTDHEELQTSQYQQQSILYYLQIPLSISLIHKTGHFEFEIGADLNTRKYLTNSDNIRNWNLLGGGHLGFGYYVHDRTKISLRPAFLTDLTQLSDQFRNSYFNIGFDTAFFW